MIKPQRKSFPNTNYGTNLYISALHKYVKQLENTIKDQKRLNLLFN